VAALQFLNRRIRRVVRLFDDTAAEATMRRIDAARAGGVSLERVRCITALARIRRFFVRRFVLIILAACRRHGSRSEQGDHAAMPVRRYPMARGAAACA
jgi:hypothetical protein